MSLTPTALEDRLRPLVNIEAWKEFDSMVVVDFQVPLGNPREIKSSLVYLPEKGVINGITVRFPTIQTPRRARGINRRFQRVVRGADPPEPVETVEFMAATDESDVPIGPQVTWAYLEEQDWKNGHPYATNPHVQIKQVEVPIIAVLEFLDRLIDRYATEFDYPQP